MSTLDQIHEAVNARITALQREIAALEAARAALRGESAGQTTSVASRRSALTPRSPRVVKAASNGNAVAAATASGAPAAEVSPAVRTEKPARRKPAEAASASKAASGSDGNAGKARGRARAKPSASRKSVEVLLAGKLEAMLRESEDGLSAITISKRSNAGYTQVLALLRELEGTGRVRRSGTRRTSLWRVVTDEERIAERAAELEALSAGKSSAPAA